jgi:hypothetical protein
MWASIKIGTILVSGNFMISERAGSLGGATPRGDTGATETSVSSITHRHRHAAALAYAI